MVKKTTKKSRAKLIIVNPVEIYFTEAEEESLRESLKNLNKNQILRDFAIVNIVEVFETANKRKDINWRKVK